MSQPNVNSSSSSSMSGERTRGGSISSSSSMDTAVTSSTLKRKQNKENQAPTTSHSLKRKKPSPAASNVCKQLFSTPEKKMRAHSQPLNEIEYAKFIEKDAETTVLMSTSPNQIDLNTSDLKPQLLPLFRLDSSDDQTPTRMPQCHAEVSPQKQKNSGTLQSPPEYSPTDPLISSRLLDFQTNQETHFAIIHQTCLMAHAADSSAAHQPQTAQQSGNAWKESHELINLGHSCESLVASTPSKMKIENATARIYHKDEQEVVHIQIIEEDKKQAVTQADLDKSFTSPLLDTNGETSGNSNQTTTAVSAESVEHAATNAQTVPTNTHDDSEEEDEEAIEVNEEDILTFATSLLEKFFSTDEIKSNIFGDKNNVSRSRTRPAFSVKKTQEFKAKLSEHFSLSEEELESAWNRSLRVKLNSKIGALRRRIK